MIDGRMDHFKCKSWPFMMTSTNVYNTSGLNNLHHDEENIFYGIFYPRGSPKVNIKASVAPQSNL